MQTITTEQELLRMLKERPEKTTTYAVTKELLGRIPRDDAAPLRVMTADEVHELSEYLETPAHTLGGSFHVADIKCPKCARQLTFLDFVKTASEGGHHERSHLRDVLTGKAGSFITIRGKDGGRPVACAACGSIVALLRRENGGGYSEYSSSSYAYA